MLRTKSALVAALVSLTLTACSKDHGSDPSASSSGSPATKPTTSDPSSPPPRSGAIPQLRKAAPAATASDLPAEANPPSAPKLGGHIDTLDGLRYIDEKVGDGATPVGGQPVRVHYTGWLTDGKKFDSSRDRDEPFTFTFGAGEVIKGWDIGLSTMRVGGRRRLIIPAELAYGDRGAGREIPPGSTLVFDVELLAVGGQD